MFYHETVQKISTAQSLQQRVEVTGNVGIARAQIRYFAACMQDRGVVAAAEGVTDVRQTQVREFLGQSHGYLARPRNRARALLRVHFGDLDLVVVGDDSL